ncbi:MAG: MSMEG_0569 family flavin-dependent oxidoreductase [Hyphomicrobiales bacterium]|nr:MSMEG_0569 family flavin-dependent oxidoreductase [Hyphomicrobiales bacterium]
MSAEHRSEHRYGAVVVGGGQAGLSASYWLSQAGVDHVVFEKKSVMHKWRDERWDNFCLVTPNWQCQLPGHPYDGSDPHGFMVKPEILAYLDGFARKTNAAVREGVEVLAVERERDLFRVTTSEGSFLTEAVFLATSLYGDPYRPRSAERVPDSVAQIHSAEYRNAAALPPGSVVVVGSGQSGAQIAEDLHLDGRKVHLVTGNAPRCARFYRGRDVVDWLWDIGQYEITVADEGMGRKRSETNHYLTGRDGGRDIDLRAFAREGMSLYGRLKDVANGRMMFELNLESNLDGADRVYNGINALIDRHIADKGIDAPPGSVYEPVWTPHEEPEALDLVASGVAAIVWATGFTPDWSYVRLPIFDGSGYPVNRRGVTSVPGVYVLGLPWLWTWGSGRFLSVGRDAESVVQHWLQGVGMVSAA